MNTLPAKENGRDEVDPRFGSSAPAPWSSIFWLLAAGRVRLSPGRPRRTEALGRHPALRGLVLGAAMVERHVCEICGQVSARCDSCAWRGEVLRRYTDSVKVGVISDVHGDIAALDTALGHLRRMSCDLILCAGDLLDVEPFGEEVVQRLKAEKVTCIRGNHERWALERRRCKPHPRKIGLHACDLSDLAGGGADLSRDSLLWLATLPTHWTAKLAGAHMAMWHARPGSDMEGIEAGRTSPALRRRLLDQCGTDVLVVGHTHDAFELRAGKGRILNPGACCSKTYAFKWQGSPAVREGFRPATFAVLELPSKRFIVFRVGDGKRV